MKRTPLYEEHVAAGARMVEFAGWEMPVQYSSIIDEHMAVRRAAGLFDVSHMGELEISGAGAEACCARLFANDARRLRPGRAQYSLITNEAGGVVDDIIVYRLEAERFLVCVNASNAAKDAAWVAERAPADCRVEDVSSAYALIAVQGPGAADCLAALSAEARGLARFACGRFSLDAGVEIEALVARTGYTGEDGFELFVAADAAAELWRVLVAGGAAPVGLGARDTLRLEAGLPLYGHELDEDISPFEAGLAWVVKLDRPELIGYEALGRAAESPRRALVGLEIDGGIGRAGCAVLASGTDIGMVTSGSYGPAVERAVALALVARDAARDDLAVLVRKRPRPARVTDVPFYVRHAAST